MWHGSVMGGQDAPNYVFINGDAESQGDLMSGSRAAPGWIAQFRADNGIDEFFGGSLWTGLTPTLRRKQKWYFWFLRALWRFSKVEGLSTIAERLKQVGRMNRGAQSCDETIRCPEIRGSLP